MTESLGDMMSYCILLVIPELYDWPNFRYTYLLSLAIRDTT